MGKKDRELRQLKAYVSARNIMITDQEIEASERPDFRLQVRNQRIGVEITEYHVGGRRQIEEEWERLWLKAYTRVNYPNNRFLTLYFRKMRVPTRHETDRFINEVLAFGELNPAIETEPDPHQYPLLSRYVYYITVERAEVRSKIRIKWFWNYATEWVGLLETELISIVTDKTKSCVQSADAYWLVIVGGDQLSTCIPLMDVGELRIMSNLEKALVSSPFDRIAILTQPLMEWRRNEGWVHLT